MLELSRIVTQSKSSRPCRTCATTRGRVTTTSELCFPSIASNKINLQLVDRHPIYLSTTEKPSSKEARASTHQQKDRQHCLHAPAPPLLLKSRTRASKLRIEKSAPRSASSLADESFAVGIVSVGAATRSHASTSTSLFSPRSSTCVIVSGRREHAAGTRLVPGVAFRCCHIIHKGPINCHYHVTKVMSALT
jgi:hypothetical protein